MEPEVLVRTIIIFHLKIKPCQLHDKAEQSIFHLVVLVHPLTESREGLVRKHFL